MKLDRIDFRILAELQNDARLSNKELAAKVELAPSTCLERVRRLRTDGALLGFHADVDSHAFGIGMQAMIAVRLQRHTREIVENFQAYVLTLDEVVAVYHLAGATDFLVHVAVRDADHLRTLALDSFTARTEVSHIETSLVFATVRKPILPNYAAQDEQASPARGARLNKIRSKSRKK